MSKLLIISDLHWGCRNDLPLFYGYFSKFYDDMFDYILANDIKHLFILGDVYDRRRYINFKTLNHARQILFDRLKQYNITTHIVIGNHDMHYREETSLCSPNLLLTQYDNVIIYDKPNIINIDGTIISMIPWICKENEQQIYDFIETTTSDLCFGHFELANFPMYKGIDCTHGREITVLSKYELVCSGHYHTRSRRDNIVYTGSPYQMNWQDCDDDKGFHIFDCDSREIEFVSNNHKIFHKILYNQQPPQIDYDVKDCFVRVITIDKGNLYEFDQFINSLYNSGCYDIKIVEDVVSNIAGNECVADDVNLEDTLIVLSNYIDSLKFDNSEQLKTFMQSLYIEAVNLEVV